MATAATVKDTVQLQEEKLRWAAAVVADLRGEATKALQEKRAAERKLDAARAAGLLKAAGDGMFRGTNETMRKIEVAAWEASHLGAETDQAEEALRKLEMDKAALANAEDQWQVERAVAGLYMTALGGGDTF